MSALADLEARLLVDPDDGDACLVYADLLQSAGDPRGELIALQHAIAHSNDPTAASSLVARAAALLSENRAKIFGQPGGFPFQRRWFGRSYLRYTQDQQRAAAGSPTSNRVLRFLDELTDSTGPDVIRGPWNREIDLKLSTFGYQLAPAGPADEGRRWQRGPGRHVEVHPIVADLLEAWPSSGLILDYAFHLSAPWSKVPLPYHDGAFYADGGASLVSALRVRTDTRSIALDLAFPFLDLDAEFVRCYDEIVARLGPFIDGHFHHHRAPTVAGARMSATIVSFDRSSR